MLKFKIPLSKPKAKLRFCVDCKYHKSDPVTGEYPTCEHPSSARKTKPCMVTGEAPLPEQYHCSTARLYNCGKKAKYWEPKEK